ncbi:hypothetical protein H5410_049301 [Solanum commersonii]|uniref:Uncharacterized protein n=1 Tax=Solanum commersonii TaxID=4109 RepID=A0A9J5WSK8_SOLCO|nr:hypothetical protein H5410_049301 [Solanum commersonii]
MGFTYSGDRLTFKTGHYGREGQLLNREVYLLRESFDLENGPFWPRGTTGSIGKVLTDVQVKFCKNEIGILDNQKIHGL